MADNGRWFKLWTSAVDDPALDNLDVADFGRWAKLGAIIKEHGERGSMEIAPPSRSLCAKMQVSSFDELIFTLKKLPNIIVDEKQKDDNGKTTVSFKHWYKYQEDSNGYGRVKKWRETQNETALEEKRREEKRRDKEEKKIKELSSDSLRLAELLLSEIQRMNPNGRLSGMPESKAEATKTRWAEDIDKLLRLDKKEPSIVEEVIRWCQQDGFWRSNILSGQKLREKWDTLTAQMSRKKGESGNGRTASGSRAASQEKGGSEGAAGKYAGIGEKLSL